ncbi:hypothetical protein [Cystobacter ferrugineus]|uniref:Uncharacterized protein n=1 Tax=Cystobacter ferrugineus TaxID=83449 RepID=A0A1L9B7L2_9BACT|nr:hypothetical protein [Cystobacter ferrugineus]OJH38240.1 hypothetical protein BON30_24160 [Cystobacter ferrugineus]
MRPADIEQLAPTLETLATYGGGRPASEHISWLRDVGAAVEDPTAWTLPSIVWLEAVAPARDRLDVLRRTAIRDPGYRAHLDLSLASVLSTIGSAERWKRFEELIQGPLLPFAPRFVQLLEWLERWRGQRCRMFDASVWQDAEELVAGGDGKTFAAWDQKLWGAGGNTATLFPLLQDQYVPLLEHPVHFSLDALQLDQKAETLLRSLVEAARRGEGVGTTVSQQGTIDVLLRAGVPLRLYAVGAQVTAALVGAVSISAKTEPDLELQGSRSFAFALPEHALRSCAWDSAQHAKATARFWEWAESSGQDAVGFLSVDDQLRTWPEQRAEAPPWGQLPVAASLRGMARARRESPEVDEALLALANHLLFGFVLQLLLVEALDRELGEETLVLAPPTDRRVDDIEGATHVFYRPRGVTSAEGASLRQDSYDLGTLDSVFGELAKSVGIRSIAYAYRGTDLGPWSRALRIMRSAELVVGLYDRWSIAPHVLDRLHGGGMMTTVIRRGRQFRERLHSELHLMWTGRRNAAQTQEVQHG